MFNFPALFCARFFYDEFLFDTILQHPVCHRVLTDRQQCLYALALNASPPYRKAKPL